MSVGEKNYNHLRVCTRVKISTKIIYDKRK